MFHGWCKSWQPVTACELESPIDCGKIRGEEKKKKKKAVDGVWKVLGKKVGGGTSPCSVGLGHPPCINRAYPWNIDRCLSIMSDSEGLTLSVGV